MAWQPMSASLAIACGTDMLQMWDLGAERCARQISLACMHGASADSDGTTTAPPHTPHVVRCLGADLYSPVVVAGCADGVARAIDPRVAGPASVVASFGPFASGAPLSHLSLQLAAASPWVAAATPLGDIAMWDWRRAASSGHATPATPNATNSGGGGPGPAPLSVHSITSHRSSLSALALHPTIPRLASGSRNQFIKVFDVNGAREGGSAPKEVHTIRYFDGFLGSRIGAVTCLAYHPTRALLAVGATDTLLSIYASPNDYA
jgi:WD40 repeat protein